MDESIMQSLNTAAMSTALEGTAVRAWDRWPVEVSPEWKPNVAARPLRAVWTFERLLAVLAGVALLPLMALIALAIKLDGTRGPVLYWQERVGMDRRRRPGRPPGDPRFERRRTNGYGRPFRLCKFRTMVPDAEARTGPVWASRNDPRTTSIGRVLRRLRLDEFPQLINVVRGDMRLIGPRPERPHFVEQLSADIPEYPLRLTVPPGITGLAQIEQEYDSDLDDVRRKVKYDLFYARHQCGLMDAKILWRTLGVMLNGKGAH
ncbi:MAG: sugar transferase [Candidatus Eisenbacteria bacterium]